MFIPDSFLNFKKVTKELVKKTDLFNAPIRYNRPAGHKLIYLKTEVRFLVEKFFRRKNKRTPYIA